MSAETLRDEKIGVIGLGYVGLPLALAFAERFPGTVGFDVHERKVEALRQGIDVCKEGLEEELARTTLTITSDPERLRGCTFFVVGVPTPIDENNNPDLRAVCAASETVARVMSPGCVVVFESTVYPGVTEEVCGPLMERVSGMVRGRDFFLGYSPERINPGDREHSLRRIVKVVSGEDPATLERVAQVYGSIIEAGVHRAPSIKVAEAAKVIENTQRDLNIALMNELSIIFDRMNISTHEVLRAAETKWNFLKFYPGLVGGHCIGVDPYYLTTKAEQLGYIPQVILAGRRINDEMGFYVGQRLVKLMVNAGLAIRGARVGVLGLTFKENVADIRNSRVPDIIHELREFGIEPMVHDPLADSEEAFSEYRLEIGSLEQMTELDAVVLAVPHRQYLEMGGARLAQMLRPNGVFADLRAALSRGALPQNLNYWSL